MRLVTGAKVILLLRGKESLFDVYEGGFQFLLMAAL